MRYTSLFATTMRRAPHGSKVLSFQLLSRAGYLRQTGHGLYAYLPLGMRVIEKLKTILREEMNYLGGQEVLAPLVSVPDGWQRSGRDRLIGAHMASFRDRFGRSLVLSPTHEEAMVELVRSSVTSYRQLPVFVYQIQNKFRDEERTRGGLIRAREFLMKDGYSFHRTFADLNNFFPKVFAAYKRIFARCGLPVIPAEAGVGYMGGDKSFEFLLPSDAGEDTVIRCPGCGYTANSEVAFGNIDIPSEVPAPITRVPTPGCRTVEQLAAHLHLPRSKIAKAMVFSAERGPVLAVVRGDHDVSIEKLTQQLQEPIHGAAPIEELQLHGLIPGYLSPIGLEKEVRELDMQLRIVIDESVANTPNLVYGTNDHGYHYLNVNFGRDFETERVADISRITAGHTCFYCNTPLERLRAIELGNIFRLGDYYTRRMELTLHDERGNRVYPQMGSYGIGLGRLMAAIVENGHDEHGIIWPPEIAPYQAYLMSIGKSASIKQRAERLYKRLGDGALLDDRNESVSVKFKDADLIGVPYRVVLSSTTLNDGMVEVRERAGGTTYRVSEDSIVEQIAGEAST